MQILVEQLIPLVQACKLLGIDINKNTRTGYREYLGLEPGQLFDRVNILRLHKMYFWCSRGTGGKYSKFTKPEFARLEREDPDYLEQKLRELGYAKPDFL